LNVVSFLTNMGPFFWTAPAMKGHGWKKFHKGSQFTPPRPAGCFLILSNAVNNKTEGIGYEGSGQ
jgi:hypothetical protein